MNPLRWRQRLDNLGRALERLREAVNIPEGRRSVLESEGLIQRFEFTYDLAWKTLKDYLEFAGIEAEPTPRDTIKAGFAAGIIIEGHIWMEMLESRNLMSHTYDELKFTETVRAVSEKYTPCIEQLYRYLRSKAEN